MSHKCDQCDYTTGQKVSLRRHQLAIHVGQKRECSFCDKMYKWEVDLRKHVTSYHQDKKFTCDDCGQVFEQRRSFLSHRKGFTKRWPESVISPNVIFKYPLVVILPWLPTSGRNMGWESHPLSIRVIIVSTVQLEWLTLENTRIAFWKLRNIVVTIVIIKQM